jgi:hypothetical protein
VRNIEEWIKEVYARLMKLEKGIYRIRQMGKLKKRNDDGMNSRRIEARLVESRGG